VSLNYLKKTCLATIVGSRRLLGMRSLLQSTEEEPASIPTVTRSISLAFGFSAVSLVPVMCSAAFGVFCDMLALHNLATLPNINEAM